MSKVSEFFKECTNEQLLRVARTEPEDWNRLAYRPRLGRRCLLGHIYDVKCRESFSDMKERAGHKTLDPTPARNAECEYMTLARETGEEQAAIRCINLAVAELQRRGIIFPEVEELRRAVVREIQFTREPETAPNR